LRSQGVSYLSAWWRFIPVGAQRLQSQADAWWCVRACRACVPAPPSSSALPQGARRLRRGDDAFVWLHSHYVERIAHQSRRRWARSGGEGRHQKPSAQAHTAKEQQERGTPISWCPWRKAIAGDGYVSGTSW